MCSSGSMTPSELNNMAEHDLLAHVSRILRDLNAGVDPDAQGVQPVSPFVTAHVLLRLHNLVTNARNKGDTCGGWPKQATLAKVVACFTGVKLKRSDAEFVGNAQDGFLCQYRRDLQKARNSDSQELSRARKRGVDVQPMRAAQLMAKIYICRFGGVPRVAAAESSRMRMPLLRLPVPPKSFAPVSEINVQLQEHILKLQQERDECARQAKINLSTLCIAIEHERLAREQAESRATEAMSTQQQEAAAAAARVQSLKAQLRDADLECKRALGKLDRLGSQVSAAHIEVARSQEREEKFRQQAVQAATNAANARAEEVELAALEVLKLKKRVKEAEKECKHAQGELARLGTQVGAAHVEVARAREREEKVRKQAEEAATVAAEAQVEAVATVTKKLRAIQQERRDCDAERSCAAAQLHRLGSQLGVALVEAARAAESAKAAHNTAEELRERLRTQEDRAAEELAHVRALKSKMAKRARQADKRAGESDQLRAELRTVRHKLKEARKQLNYTQVQLNLNASEQYLEEETESEGEVDAHGKDDGDSDYREFEDDDTKEVTTALKRLRSMPTWRPVRGKGQGKGEAKLEWGTRLIIYSLLAMMVPPSAIGMAIVAIVKRTAPWLDPIAPTFETVRRCRFELRFLEEAVAARRIAAAFSIRSIGYDETTKFGNASLTSNVQIQVSDGAPLEDVIVRAAYCPLGATAELVVSTIETKCFSRLRDFLRRWKEIFERMHPTEKWTGPDSSQCSLHRLGGGGAIITDTCNTARKSRQLLAELVARQLQEHLGTEAWEAMSEAERNAAARTHNVDCWQHLRNIFLAEMSRAQAQHVQAELKPELDTFGAWERMCTDFQQLLRASFKEFHHSCRYYKGQGRSYCVWLRETYPSNFCINLERADGGRQDLDYDAAVPLYVDRKYFIEFLHERVFLRNHSNILEDFLYITFSSVQYVAMTRANALVDVLISRPLRWLSGKSSQLHQWSPRSMGKALDLVEQFLMRAQHNGSLFLDPELDIFEAIAHEQPMFAAWRQYTRDEDSILSPDGQTKHLVWRLALDELRSPADATNASTREKCIEYLEVQCVAALRKMHDPKLALRDKLTSMDGENSYGRSQQAHLDTVGCHATNDALAESVFGTYDMILRRCPGISMEAASGVAQAVRSMMLSHGDQVAHRKQHCKKKEKEYTGWFYGLPEKEQEALVELARTTVREMRGIDRSDHRNLDEYHKSRRKRNEEDELDALFTQYALALSFFERWCKRGVDTVGAIASTLSGYGDRTQEKLDWLREQIEMRTIGLSWSSWKTPWSSSSDEYVGTVEHLVAHLKAVLDEEKGLERRSMLPSKSRALASAENLSAECPAPQLKRKTFKSLGTPTVQAQALSIDKTDLSPDQIVAAAERRRKELEEAGEIDWVCDRQPYPTGQGPVPDKALVGKTLEVRWRYYNKGSGEPVYIWCQGEVVQAADGETDKRTPRCRKVLPAGALRIKWPADVQFDEDESFVWSMLHPKSFNKDVHLGWRFATCELKRMEEAEQTMPGGAHKKKKAK